MNSTKPHAYPGYEELSAQFDYAAQIGTKFSPMMCQSLLETAETYAQEASTLPQVEAKLMETRMMLAEMIEHFKMPHLNKEARTALLERAGKVLKNDQNESAADGRAEASE
jgi:uncharacterized protein YcaQ